MPSSRSFQNQKKYGKNNKYGFPLKDESGNIRVSKEGIDNVISTHFSKVFAQNQINDGWEEYWDHVVKIYDTISEQEVFKDGIDEPTFEEISIIMVKLDKTKDVHGSIVY